MATVERSSTPERKSESPMQSSEDSSKPINNKREKEKKPGTLKQIWTKLGLDVPTLMLMAKGGLPPAIALALYQADPVANTFSTLGYLVAVVSILGFAIMPRAKFIQTMTLNLLTICFGTAMAMLTIWTAVKARQHTTPVARPGQISAPVPGAQTSSYNSSASAVAGIWMFFQIYAVNAFRAKFPQFILPTILYSIFVVVSTTYATQLPTMTAGLAFGRQLLEAFLAGFAISTAVSFLVYPTTSRKIVFKEMAGYINAIRGALKAESAYFHSLEKADVFALAITRHTTGKEAKERSAEANAVKRAVAGVQALHGRLHGDLPFAKREVALGRLGPDDLNEIAKLLRLIMLPLVGLSSVIDIFERLAELHEWTQAALEEGLGSPEDEALRKKTIDEWNEIMKSVHDPFASITQVMDEGLVHFLYRLRLAKPPKSDRQVGGEDVEAKGDAIRPGDKEFATYFDQRSEEFWNSRQTSLRALCIRRGMELPEDFFENPETASVPRLHEVRSQNDEQHQRRQRQLYMLLYMEFLLYTTSRAVLNLIRFADAKAESGKLAKKRLIVPGVKRIRKWLASTLKSEDASHDRDHHVMSDIGGDNNNVDLGEAYKGKKDPEHLPPRNAFERLGNRIRIVPRILRSPESAFGFRAACATMSIGIMCYVRPSQAFFIQQRVFWAMIMVAISMNPTAGSSFFSFVLRILGTVIAMVASFLIYYIPGQKTPGILVFLWLWTALILYIPLKQPRFTIVGMISSVTVTLIIGYELEVRKIGAALATSNGQAYYPLYILGPYRLATVCGGLAVAFIWIFFPYPISEHSQIRRSLGGSLYLLANYYSIIHETVQARIRGDGGDPDDKLSPGRRLEKARNKVYAKQMLIIAGMRTNSDFLKWEVPIGGRFPKERYATIIQCVENILNYSSLVAIASKEYTHTNSEDEVAWINNFRRLIRSVNMTSHEITSTLCLLSSSISSGQPLPPYLTAPKPYQLSARLEVLDKDILSFRHIAEPGYAAFAVMQISTRCIIGDLERLLTNVKALVGELDFSFHTVSTSASSNASSDTLWTRSGNREKND